MAKDRIRIGSASGFWGDSAAAAPQLVRRGDIQYLVFDYLAEVTMSIMAAQKAKDPNAGYARDFVDITMRQLLVRSSAGAIISNSLACRRRFRSETISASTSTLTP